MPTKDLRPILRLSQDTWDREADPAGLVDAATAIGSRLVIVTREGREWTPAARSPQTWSDPYRTRQDRRTPRAVD